MNYKIKRIISTICLVAAVVSVTFFPVSASCETLRFVFLADSRAKEGDDALVNPVNTKALEPIIEKIKELTPRPAFVMFGGDMSYRGYIYTDSNPMGYTFQSWKDLFKDLTDAGIPLYTAIGNHELYRHDDNTPTLCTTSFCLDNQKEYKKVFSENPQNGPKGYKPGYDGLVYSFTSPGGDAFFAVLDPYYITQNITPANLGGHIDDVQLKWLKKEVAKTRATHKFLFIHTPYYYVTGQTPGDEEYSVIDESFLKLWTVLDNNRFDFYACGHQHLYSRKTINLWVLPKPQTMPPPPWRHNVVQLLNGTSGADPDQGTPTVKDPKSWHIHQDPNTYYFSVVDIDGRCAKVTSYSYNTDTKDYGMVDEFTISHNPFDDISDQSVYNQDVLQYPWICY
jgi:hypothetical protein